MSTKPKRSAIPPVLVPPLAETPARPTLLAWLCASCFLVGLLGLSVCLVDGVSLIATIVDQTPFQATRTVAPSMKLMIEKRQEIHLVRQYFLPANLLIELGLFLKSAALIVGGIAAFCQIAWGRWLLIWTFRIGIWFLILATISSLLEASYEFPILARYHQLQQALVNKSGTPPTDVVFLAILYGWNAFLLVLVVLQGVAFYFGARYLDGDESRRYFGLPDEEEAAGNIVFAESAAAERETEPA